MRRIPVWIARSEREYKRTKRRQWAIVRQRLIGWKRRASWWSNFGRGSAWIPREAYLKLDQVHKLLLEIDEILKEWWKND